MTRWIHDAEPPRVERWTADGELRQQVLPLEVELPLRDPDSGNRPDRSDLASVEVVSARCGFVMNRPEIGIDRQTRRWMVEEALELRVMPVAARFTPEHGTREQCFAPQGDQPLRVEISRVKRPETHVERELQRDDGWCRPRLSAWIYLPTPEFAGKWGYGLTKAESDPARRTSNDRVHCARSDPITGTSGAAAQS